MRMTPRRKHWLKPPGPVAPGLRIGLLGGSFNPAHGGHMHISEVALKRLGLDYVWWLVAPHNPLKPTIGMAPLDDRVSLATETAKHPRVLVMDIEAALGTRYTIDTLGALTHRFPQLRFVWLMGSDNLDEFRRWRRWTDIAARISIAVVMRPGSTLAPLRAKAAQRLARSRLSVAGRIAFAPPPAFVVLDGPRNTASATAIRDQSRTGEALVGAIPSW
jgi:nicotinate-nucleotide adenylyltransferase